jgi:CheY-like chemotaxis protein
MKNDSSNLIFIVDDDPDDRQIILDAFIQNNPSIDYIFMESAGDLLTNLYSEDTDFPTLILLDLNMPGILGLHALKEIRADKKFSHIPIVVLTTSSLHTDKRSSYDLGANCFVRKPDSFRELVDITQSIVRLWLFEKLHASVK